LQQNKENPQEIKLLPMAGIYIHFPFCKSRCIYCGFYSTTLMELRGKYVDALCREMYLRRGYVGGSFSTIYIGGGTPSLLPAGDLERLLYYIYNVYRIEPGAEVTIECNPDDITPAYARLLGRLPVNRVSMGAQTFSDSRLKFLNRRHRASDVERAVRLLRAAGIMNISIDLMFGFPEETLAEWTDDIMKALELGVEHISAYSLMYEEGTALWRMLEQKKVEEADEELSLAMYEELVSRLAGAGYEHYEISNFAKPGFRSRHNSSYWKQVPYIGLGAAAHSYDLNSRQWNVADVRIYISEIDKGVVPMEREELDKDTMFNDIVTTAMRTCEGIDLAVIESKFGEAYRRLLLESSERHVLCGLAEVEDGHLRLTRKGIYVSDSIMSDLMKV